MSCVMAPNDPRIYTCAIHDICMDKCKDSGEDKDEIFIDEKIDEKKIYLVVLSARTYTEIEVMACDKKEALELAFARSKDWSEPEDIKIDSIEEID